MAVHTACRPDPSTRAARVARLAGALVLAAAALSPVLAETAWTPVPEREAACAIFHAR